MATQVLVKFRGTPEKVLKTLVKEGIFGTKSEAVRAGVITLGKEYSLLKPARYYREKLEKGLAKVSPKDIENALEELEE